MSGPTIKGRGSASAPVATTQSGAAPADDWASLAGASGSTGQDAASTGGTGSPRIVVESAAGHTVILTYEDLVLAALVIGLTVQVWGWYRG